MSDAGIQDDIRLKAYELGFDAVGFAPVTLEDDVQAGFAAFLNAGLHGEMDWLEAKVARRLEPRALWPEVRSVIAVAMSYKPEEGALDSLDTPGIGHVSVYARGRDYHDVVKKRLKALGRWICESFPGDVKVFVDTAPVMEKPLGMRAGLGWQGKHTNLVSRDHGSWLFLGEVFTTLDLPESAGERDHCGNCRNCLDACPTGAFPAPYRIDARRCISYLTIEHKGPIPRELRPAIGNRIYGCDDCLAACPWNKFAHVAPVAEMRARPELLAPSLAELAELDDAAFRALFSKSAVKRVGRDRFVRNVMIALGNAGGAAAREALFVRLEDKSALVRGAAVWALSRVVRAEEFKSLRRRFRPGERDPDVLAEWDVPMKTPVLGC